MKDCAVIFKCNDISNEFTCKNSVKFDFGAPISIFEVFEIYFKDVANIYSVYLYRALYKLAVSQKGEQCVHEYIIDSFKKLDITNVLVKVVKRKSCLRRLNFRENGTLKSFNEAKRIIMDSIVPFKAAKTAFFNQISYTREVSNSLPSQKRVTSTNSECILLYHGLYNDKELNNKDLTSILSDPAYPFIFYLAKNRQYPMQDKVKRMIEKPKPKEINLKALTKNFNIRSLNLYAHVCFYVANKFAFNNPESMQLYDKRLAIACDRIYITKDAQYYKSLYKHQFYLSTSASDYSFLFDKREYNQSILDDSDLFILESQINMNSSSPAKKKINLSGKVETALKSNVNTSEVEFDLNASLNSEANNTYFTVENEFDLNTNCCVIDEIEEETKYDPVLLPETPKSFIYTESANCLKASSKKSSVQSKINSSDEDSDLIICESFINKSVDKSVLKNSESIPKKDLKRSITQTIENQKAEFDESILFPWTLSEKPIVKVIIPKKICSPSEEFTKTCEIVSKPICLNNPISPEKEKCGSYIIESITAQDKLLEEIALLFSIEKRKEIQMSRFKNQLKRKCGVEEENMFQSIMNDLVITNKILMDKSRKKILRNNK